MSHTEVSTILYKSNGDSSPHNTLTLECKRVAALGGSFSIRHFYTDNWYEEFSITYPEGVTK